MGAPEVPSAPEEKRGGGGLGCSKGRQVPLGVGSGIATKKRCRVRPAPPGSAWPVYTPPEDCRVSSLSLMPKRILSL